MKWKDAIFKVLAEEGRPMYYKDILGNILTSTSKKNSYGVQTGVYNYNGVEYNTWEGDSVPFFKIDAFTNQ